MGEVGLHVLRLEAAERLERLVLPRRVVDGLDVDLGVCNNAGKVGVVLEQKAGGWLKVLTPEGTIKIQGRASVDQLGG